jgi:hypothetical protein
MCWGGGGGDGGAAQARADEMARQARIKEGTANVNREFGRFDDNFYKDRSNAYRGFVTPQVDDQYKQVGNQLAFSLARSGLDQSSESARQQGVLMRDNAAARQAIAEGALSEVQKARQAVEEQRNNLISQVNMTSDAGLAGQNALRQAGILAMQNQFSPLSNLFQNTTGMLSAANQGGIYGGGPGVRPFKEMFGFGGPSSKKPSLYS